MISRQSGDPLYRQVADRLREAIISGRIRPGQPLPSERTLQQEYGIARETARHAVELLRREGRVVVRAGHGVVVRDKPDLTELIPPAGATVTTRMPSPVERTRLDLNDGVPVFEVVDPSGTVEVYAGDQWYLPWPG